MASLTKCLKISDLPAEDKNAIRQAAREYREDEGMSNQEAGRQAVEDAIEQAEGEKARLREYVEGKGGVVPEVEAAPKVTPETPPAAPTPAEAPEAAPEAPKAELAPAGLTAPGVSLETLPYQAAYDAHAGSSMVPDERARQRQQEFANTLQQDWDAFLNLVKTDDQRGMLEAEFSRYVAGYRQKYLAALAADARTLSAMVTGPANFPTARNEKRLEIARKRWDEVSEYRERARKAITKTIRPDLGPISSDATDAVDRLREKLAQLEADQERMKEINKAVRKKDDARLKELGLSDAQITQIYEPDFAGRPGIPSYMLTNNNANIRRVRQRIAELEERGADETREVAFDGGTVVDNVEANRLQIFYGQKPSEEVRKDLKAHGFHWSPQEGAWQRKRGSSANSAAQTLTGVTIEKSAARPRGVSGAAEAKPPSKPGSTLYSNPVSALGSFYVRNAEKAYNALAARFQFIAPLGDLPNKNDYLARRYRTIGKLDELDQIAKNLAKAFSKVTPDQQGEIYTYFTTKDADPQLITHALARTKAVAAKRLIDRIGRRLVEVGWLPRQTHEDEYLPRVYLKHLLGKDFNTFAALGTGKKLSSQGYLKKRLTEKELPEDIRRIVLGEVTDPGYLSGRAIATPGRDLEILSFLTDIAGRRDWVAPKSVVPMIKYGTPQGPRYRMATRQEMSLPPEAVQYHLFGPPVRYGPRRNPAVTKVTPWWLKQEAARLREQATHMEPANARAARQVADDYQAMADQAFEEMPTPDAEKFRQIPKTKRYGPLAGLWVQKNIWEDIVGFRMSLGDAGGLVERILGQGGLIITYVGLWKGMKVAMNYPTQVRNFVSNGVLLHISGVPLVRVPDRILAAAHQMATNGRAWRVAKRYGVRGATFSQQEIRRIERDLTKIQSKNPLSRLLDMGAAVYNAHSDFYGLSEGLFKTAKIIDEMAQGRTPEAAAMAAHEALFDYSLVPNWTRFLRSYGVAPFVTFYYKAAGAFTKVAITHPERLLPYVLIPYLITEYIAAMYDVDDDDIDQVEKNLPRWLQERGGTAFLPVKDEHGRWQAVSYGYFLPWQMFSELYGEASRGQAGEFLQTTGLLGGPVFDIVAAIKTNRDPFTQKEIRNKSDPPAKQLADMMLYLYRLNAPTYLTDIGFAGHVWRAAHDETLTSRIGYGEPGPTMGQAVGRLFGVNVYPIDPDLTRMQNLANMDHEIADIKARLSERLRKIPPNLPEAEYNKRHDKLVGQYQEIMLARRIQRAEYLEESEPHPNLMGEPKRTLKDIIRGANRASQTN